MLETTLPEIPALAVDPADTVDAPTWPRGYLTVHQGLNRAWRRSLGRQVARQQRHAARWGSPSRLLSH